MHLCLGATRLFERRLGVDGNEGVQLRVQSFDPAQALLGELDGRDPAIPKLLGDFENGQGSFSPCALEVPIIV